jgi:hypothetical protein
MVPEAEEPVWALQTSELLGREKRASAEVDALK